ncbi:hypothetical protein K469DRAFT_628515 [Zopfia rhizophila CBS 207.26]|uniref:U6 snRNA phosphodiesterase n=1 Tax=Zopfia rhizophila CBS 207.26 TaxID=1314779 RepID=A0A6A6EA49_9PEZI|nr:hypothetical protein K469DRAFT_628515 [Zopfia rhizophila CBS 207.26]
MALVQYSDSDSDDGENEASTPAQTASSLPEANIENALKRKRDDAHSGSELPPLPAAFHDLYSTNTRVSTRDDPSLHGGRKRAVPHIEGNWPSHVYLEWIPSHTESQHLQNLIDSVQASIADANKSRARPISVPDITPLLRSPLGAPLPLHISLSRTLQIRTEDRETFLETLTSSLNKAAVKTFPIRFTSLRWVPNFERNRWFLILGIAKPPRDELNKLLTACNQAAERRGHPGLYTGGKGDGPMDESVLKGNARKRKKEKDGFIHINTSPDNADRSEAFHISIAWSLVGPAPEWMALLETVNVKREIQSPKDPIDAVKIKIGNVIHNFALGAKKVVLRKGEGILGLG